MRHSLEIDGCAFRLRPVQLEDAEFIVGLRADPERGRYLHRGCTDASAQQQWLRGYFKTPGDCYFIIENRFNGTREGTAGIYNLNPARKDAEWGRWILRRGSLAALESACLVYRLGFERLAVDVLYCRTIAENTSALAFHDSFGVERIRRLPRYLAVDGRHLDAIEGRLTRGRWLATRDAIEAKAARAAGWTASAYAAATS